MLRHPSAALRLEKMAALAPRCRLGSTGPLFALRRLGALKTMTRVLS
jgi:hypothetical protein